MNYINVSNPSATHATLSVEEIIETTEQMQVQMDVWRSRLRFSLLWIQPCPLCGRKVKFIEGPHERLKMCRHVIDELKRQCDAVSGHPPATTGAPSLFGLEVEIVR